ncbi:succinyldiaminopimelate desuccinylase [Roseibium hamelinense]|uniref:Succinyl-diaminopimelate desuccinylase n=1 Tax=Roseibium hamelinense TaxID=150831 RepID=A0A562SHL6_9HYPH|nr:succinyl-diaminopimelate desuccinylase [Roseibium hamelinense]MTI43898.1 succinyl-diaminopimelate desuccinylase [Roseibium hamelinense]TWI80807.1 succinyldiaminopimelate desuccinylase [Roseibium hamelinense]
MNSETQLVTEIAQELIRCDSVTPNEGGALTALGNRLEAAGFGVERIMFSDDKTPDVDNLFATIGTGGPHFVFAGHTDVVPPGASQDWTFGPFEGHVDAGLLYGRGAVDMKGGVAAFAAAAISFLKERPMPMEGRISFLITGDEEGPAINGTRKLLEWAEVQGHRFDGCIVGEPTNPKQIGDAIKVGRRGSLSGTIVVSGVQGHAAYPHLADNPIPKLVTVLSALNGMVLDAGNDRFQPSNLEIVTVDVGNTAFNVIPARAVARFNIRFNDEWTLEALKERVSETVVSAAVGVDARVSLEFKRDASESFLTRDSRLIETLSKAVADETGRSPELSTGGGTSDARFIKNYCPVVEFGLVGQTMHKIDENVPLADLVQLEAIYLRFLQRYFSA